MNKNLYPNTESNPNFAKLEEKILDYWKKNNLFQKSIKNRPKLKKKENNEFIFYDGPPFANGLPHYGHLFTGYIKDLYARYQTISGKRVERRFGWDCHGLPAEMESEKELKISGRNAIIDYGIDKFNDHCSKSVMKYTQEWERYVNRQARWVDFENCYKTMDINFMESVLWAFKELHKKGYIYEDMRVMPYSWACQTPLSNFETRLDNSYRERADKAITVSFLLKDKPHFLKKDYSEYRILAWTTTPWTLPSNLALAVNPEMEYVAVEHNNICYILAKFALPHYKKEIGDNIIIDFKGSELSNIEYIPLFNYFENHENAFKVLLADFVIEGDGTGVVHMAPGFGEDDQIVCKKHGISLVCPVDAGGKFTQEVSDFAEQLVFDANDPIIIKLKKQGNWIKTEQYLHNYPHCWRTDTPLIYKAVSSWYVKVTDFSERMVEHNKQINWIPNHVKGGIFHNWLKNARDWSISRNRFWGTPIPVWRSDNPEYPRIDVYGSIEELEKDFNVKIDNLHRPYIDELVRPNPDDPTGKSMMRRVEDVFDCWFESGSMPYGQVHYPFENKEWFESHFPADFIVEYIAQTRGWFYTLMVLSTALFDKPPFLNCICHGVILDTKGQKLSKRLNNYPNPLEIFDKYGSDALRFTLISSSAVHGDDFLIDKEGKMVYDTLRLHIKPIWSAYHFFTLYANVDKIQATVSYDSDNILDKYILSKLKIHFEEIQYSLDNFDSKQACRSLYNFFDILNNWYIRRSRTRFWKSEIDNDKQNAYNTLYTCLLTICKIASPLLPLVTEEIFIGLTEEESIHLSDLPSLKKIKIDKKLVKNMDMCLEVCNAALAIRNRENIRIRQPLHVLDIYSKESENLSDFIDIIQDEVNVKRVDLEWGPEFEANERLSLNLSLIGKRFPNKVQEIIKESKGYRWRRLKNGKVDIADVLLEKDEFSIFYEPKVAKEYHAIKTGVISLTLNPDRFLRLEGIARDLIRIIQQARKKADFHITDRIYLSIEVENEINEVRAARDMYKDLIEEQTLSTFKAIDKALYSQECELDKIKCIIKLSK